MKRKSKDELKQGDRIELHPATDRWMMGDRFGSVQRIDAERIRVKLDVSGKLMWFHVDNILTSKNC